MMLIVSVNRGSKLAKQGDAQVLSYVDLDKLIVGENTRSPANLNLGPLLASVERDGIQEPLTVTVEGDKYMVQRGHRRLLVALMARKNDSSAFKHLHPKGIPVIVRHDVVTAEDAAKLKLDHGTQQSLKFMCELRRAVFICKDAGMTEEMMVFTTEGTFQRMSRALPSKTRDLIKAERAKDKPDEKLIRKLLLDTYKGQLQGILKVWACPAIVAEALEYAETGVGKATLPKHIRQKDVAGLHEAFKADMEVKDADNTQKFSKKNPGPIFNKAWANLCKQVPKKTGSRDKAMSAKSMKAQLEGGTWSSKGFQKLTLQHAGEPNVEGLADADACLLIVELVRKHEPRAWTEFKAKGEAIAKAIADGTLK